MKIDDEQLRADLALLRSAKQNVIDTKTLLHLAENGLDTINASFGLEAY
jgi:hypothetical protein